MQGFSVSVWLVMWVGVVYFRGFIHLVKLRVSWVVLGDIGWFGGTLTDRGGGSLGKLWGAWGIFRVDFNGVIVMVYRFYCT